MKKVLFLIHDLGAGGAEKVLVNLVNNMDKTKFDITVISLFGGGVNEKYLSKDINYKTIFNRMIPGNSKLMKLFTPKQLHKLFIKDKYDIEISYLEGPSARIISGCDNETTKLVSWIHCTMNNDDDFSVGYRDVEEARKCYSNFDKIICVSSGVQKSFVNYLNNSDISVLYNVNNSNLMIEKSHNSLDDLTLDKKIINLCAVGRLIPIKGFERLIKIVNRLVNENFKVRLYILGTGKLQNKLQELIQQYNLQENCILLGYQSNPYKYVSQCDLFVCSSYSEGFSTAATEALIVGTPVCTVEVSGMKEMLGENNEYGIVCDNNDEALYNAIKSLLDDPKLLAHYKQKAIERGKEFSTEKTVKAVEEMLLDL